MRADMLSLSHTEPNTTHISKQSCNTAVISVLGVNIKPPIWDGVKGGEERKLNQRGLIQQHLLR